MFFHSRNVSRKTLNSYLRSDILKNSFNRRATTVVYLWFLFFFFFTLTFHVRLIHSVALEECQCAMAIEILAFLHLSFSENIVSSKRSLDARKNFELRILKRRKGLKHSLQFSVSSLLAMFY